MTLAEQVAGRRRQILFQLYLPYSEARALLEALKRDFHGSGMHFWLLPLLDSGYVEFGSRCRTGHPGYALW
jgi:hypothetical protein